MTIRVPGDNILDKILKLFGKEREIIVPEGADKIYKELGPHVQIRAKKEGFFKALFSKTKNVDKDE
jgi:hypothetical protein